MAVLLAAGLVSSACFGPPAGPRSPTRDRISASHRNIGIPYGPWVLFRAGDRHVALRVIEASALGNRIEFEWAATAPGTERLQPTERGRGSAEERATVERIAAGPLLLNWSRGSGDTGWLYWPESRLEFAVCATTFENLDEIHPGSRRLRWYTRDMFR